MIKRLFGFILLLFLTLNNVWGQLNANFSTNPLYNTSNQLNVCAGSSVLFTFISTGSNISPTTNVSWTFTTITGTALSQTTSTLRTPFPLTFPNGTYSVTLTLNEPSGNTSSKTITVNANTAPPSTPSLSLSTFSVTGGWSATTINGVPAFSICPVNLNVPQDVTFDITPTLNCAQVTNITHTEVPSSVPIDCSNGFIDITYNPNTARFYYSVFSVQFLSCTFSRVYYVQIGTPSISITSASSSACDPGTYSLAFIDQTPGVTYQIDWDYNGTSFNSQTVYTYPNLPINPQKVSHSYPFTPCSNGTAQPNNILIRASNTTCASYSETSPSQVYVSQAPDASFTRTPDQDIICQGTQVTYTDNSNPGIYVTTAGNCNTQYHRWWTHSGPAAAFGPTTNNTANVTNLGTASTSNPGPSTFTVTYNTPGTYTIRLIVKNNSCANDTMVKTVCVVPTVNANFSTSALSGCAPINITTTNSSSLPGCAGTNMLYNWSVSNAPPTCGVPAWNFTNGTNSNSAQPQFNFSGPGVYTIRLISSLNPSVPGAQCLNDTITQTIAIGKVPEITFAAQPPICEDQSFTPQATINDCYSPTTSYLWTFTSGTPASSTVLNPGAISYASHGNYTYSLTATNSCGSDNETSTITVNQLAEVNASAASISCAAQPIALSGSISGGATGGTWSSNLGGTFLPNPTTLNASYVPPGGTSGIVSLTLTATGVISPCPAVNDVVNITINPNPIVSAGNDTSICAGSTVLLAGSIGGSASSAVWSTTGSGTFQSVSSLNTTYTPSAADVSAGSVNLILTSNDPTGPCNATKDTLNVIIKPVPTLTVGTSNAVCSGVSFSVPLSTNISSPPASFNWTLSGSLPSGVSGPSSGTISPPNNVFSATISNTSSGPVTLQYSVNAIVNGCSSTNVVVPIVVNPLPQPLITPPGPTTVCNGSTLSLSTSVFSSYLWSNNATTQSTVISTAGNYTVTVTNSYGCTGSSAASIVNFSVPITPTFDQIAPICSNGTFSLPTTSTNGISGTWSPAINNLATTTYTFTPSIGQCANTAQMIVTVNPLPSPTITANGPTTFCQGASVVLTGSGGGTYAWNLNGSAIANATAANFTATQAGNYTVTVTNANGCVATSAVQTIIINPNPQPVIVASGPTNLCQGQSITLNTSTFDTYLWSSGQATNAITVNTAGNFSVIVSAAGCSGTSNTIVVTLNPQPSATVTGTATVCENGAQPNITFTGSNAAAPYTFTYSINGGANQTITTAASSSVVTLPVPTATPGTYTYSVSNVSVGSCANPISANNTAVVTVSSNITPTFTQVGPYCNGASIPALPTTSNNSIVGTWAPAINNIATSAAVTTNYTFTPTAGAGICATTATMPVVVNPNTTPLFTQLGPYCQGATPDLLPATSNNGIAGTWSPSSIVTTAAGTVAYTFTPTSAAPATCAVPTNMSIVVTTLPAATIVGTTTVCENGAQPNITFTGSNAAAPYTFTYSINGGANQTITTAASSSVVTLPVPTATPGTYTYSVSNVSVGSCANPISANNTAVVTVSSNITPTFTQVGPYCNGASIPALPTTSNNSIVGTWAPAINNIATSAAVTTNYTFTPTAGAGICATTATMPVVVNPNTTPLFTQLGPYCQGATPDLLPATSNNGIAGTWSPSSIVTTAAGTVAYTFTPTSAAPATCAVPTNMSIVVTTLPAATIVGTTTVCENGAQPNITFTGSNAAAPYTFTYSINGGANQTITTAASSSVVTLPVPTATPGTYTYSVSNVSVGSCANPISANNTAVVTVSSNITPTFTQVGPYCNGASIPALPTTSNNSIVGTWAPAINNIATSAAVTTNYTFTPTAGAGICATTATMPVVVNPNTTPLFTQLGPYCQGATPDLLPATSNNGIAGTWSPSSIVTTAAGTVAYTFTPTSAAPATCAVPTNMSIVVTTLPAATIVGTTTVCENGAQPNITFTGSNAAAPYTFTYSINGGANQTITTAASSSVVTLPVPTATPGTYTYSVSNVSVGSCANPISANNTAVVTVSSNITPTFTQVGPYCNGASIPALPTTSNNSIVGTWAPAINNIATSAAVTTNYTFTPTAGAGICATTATMPVVVNPNTTPLFTQLGPYCQGATPDLLPATSNNGIAGTWSPSSIVTTAAGTVAYTFTPTSAAPATCAVPTNMSIVVTTLPAATIVGTTTVCENGAQPNITFTGSNAAAPYTFTYSINGGANQTITTAASSSVVTLPVPTATPGTYTYSVSNVSVGSCANPISANNTAVVTVSSNITPTFTQVGPYCNGASIPALPTTSNNSIVGTWAPAINNIATSAAVTTNYTFTPTAGAGICATTATMPVVVNPNTTPLFTQLGPYCQGATPDLLPATSNNGIAGTWSPSSIVTTAAGTVAYTFTPTSAAPATCAVPTNMSIVVTTLPAATIVGTTTVCENGAQPNITFTGSNAAAPYTFTYSINGGANQTITTAASSSVVTLPVPTATPGTYTYSVSNVSVGSCANPISANNTAVVTVSSNITPTFTQVGPYCNGASIPALPTTSNNSIVGTWAPAINNIATSAAVTTNYTFTPTAGAGICATTATMPVVVNPNTTPLFTQLGPYCQGATPDLLPATSNNGIAGTWSPSSIVTTAAGTVAYTFTPTSAAPATCAVPTNMSIVVTTLPAATIVGTTTVCENGAQPNITFTGSNAAAPYTFTYSINGGANQTITTAASSSVVTLPVPTATPGTYTYSVSNVSVGSCANPISANNTAVVTVSSNITPTFTQVGPYCNGASIPALPTTSNNSIVGTWAPAINNIATSAAVTTNYTFTPTAGAGICATTATMPVVVNPNTTPLFTQLGPYCQGATPDLLPATSNNGIAGTWSPSSIVTTAAGTVAYTFTPTSAAPATCAVPTNMSIVVTTLPAATIVGTTTVCENGAQPNITFTGSNAAAPYTFTYSINGGANQTITTAASSSVVTLPVPTATPGTYTYSVSNVSVGSCANPISANNTAVVTVSSNITPTFTQVGPYCNGASIPALPTTSNNSIVGTWAPAINNIATSAAVTTNYTFTPTAGAGICATTATMPVVVNPNTTPLFTQLGPYCQGATPDLLPATSNNGIAGTWSPSSIVTTAAGTVAYTFTPTSAAPATCAVPTNMSIVVTTLPAATIVGTTTVCENGAQPNITFTGSNAAAPYTFTYSINGGANQTITTAASSSVVTLPVPTATPGTYTYSVSNVSVGSCANPISANNTAVVTVSSNITPTFTQVGPYCNGASIPALPTTSNNSIVGTWAPAINNIATSAAVTTNYTFTPTAGAGICATTATMPVVVNPNTTPLFTQLGPYCQGATPDLLPATSNNGIAGTWSPSSIVTTAAGTVAYTFTPTSAAPATCAVPTNMSIVVTTLPAATIVGTTTVCENGAQPNITFTGSNAAAPYTFTYSINGGANQTITTAASSSVVTLPVPTATPGTYTYSVSNVSVGSCANPISANNTAVVTVSSNITPTFTQVGPYCNGASIPALPTTSNNSIVGTWAPAINNIATSAAVTTNYTFTPTAGAGICATTATMPVVVNPNTTPLFTQLGPYCQGATPDLLPATSNNGIAGTWSPSSISTVGIAGSVSSTTYSFTPNLQDANAPQCGLTGSMTILVTPLPSGTITGDTILCQGNSAPVVTFTGSNASPPYTFTYTVNNGVPQTITSSTLSSVVTLPVPTTLPGTYIYNLIGVGVGTCTNSINLQTATIQVVQTPTVSVSASSLLICPNEPVLLTAVGSPSSFNSILGSYIWSNSPTTSSSQTVNPSVVGPNNYSVVYTLNNCPSQPQSVNIIVQNAPQITIQNNPNATICEGGCVTLTAVPSASTITPSGYSWSTGETTQSIQVCPTDTTQYTVIGLSGTCQSPVATTTVNVTNDPVFSVNLIPDTAMCVGGSFTFNVATTGGVGTPVYAWYLNNQPNNYSGAAIPNSNNTSYSTPTIMQPTTQFYYVQATYPGVGCDQQTSDVAQLTVVADPIVALDPMFNQTLCEGGTATCIVPEVTGGVGNNTYLWLPTMSADSLYCPPSDQIGTQNYNVIVQQSGIGCGSIPSNTISITVVADPTIQIVGTANVCEGAEVPLITTVQGGLGTISSYQWSSSYPNGNPYVDINGANAFNYTTFILEDQVGIAVTMEQSVEGCNASDTFLINVFEDPQVSIIGDSLTCMGLVNNLQTVVTGGVPNSTNTFTWFSPGNEQNPTPVIVQAESQQNSYDGTIYSDTSYFVVLDNSGFGCDNDTSAVFEVGMVQWAVANFDIDPEIPSQSILTPTFSFINTSENSTSYLWDLGECDPQLPYSELYTSPSLSYNPNSVDQINYTYGCSPGYYSVTLYAYNQGMCPDTVTQIIRIRDEVIVYVPNAFTPGDLDNTNATFYPVITGKVKPGTYRFSIFDRWGELIFETFDPATHWDGLYNGNIVQDGVYIWKLSFIAEETGDKIDRVGHVTKLQSDLGN